MPDWRSEIRARLAELRLDPANEEQIVDELAQHLEDRYEELLRRGESRDSALATTLEELREMNLLERELKAERNRAGAGEVALGRARGRWLESVMHDVKYALRSLRKSPGYATAAALTLALGIGGCALTSKPAPRPAPSLAPFPPPSGRKLD